MKAVILAAGRGSRLHPYTENTPKCLTELGGLTLIERQLRTLRAGGIDDIILVTGYEARQLSLAGTRQVYNPHWDTTNMVESLFAVESEFDDDLIVSYGDIVYELRVLDAILASPHDTSVVVDRAWRAYWAHRFDDPLSDAESLRTDGYGRIVDIGAPVDDLNTIDARYLGLLRFRGDGIGALRDARAQLGSRRRAWMDRRPVEQAYMTDLLMEMILMGAPVHAVPVDGGWLEVDTVADYEKLARDFETGDIVRFFDPDAGVVT